MPIRQDEVVARMGELPAFPKVVVRLLDALEDDAATIGTLAHHVESDPVVTARVMSLANSAAMGVHAGRTVTNVETAASMIGIARIREIALAVSLAKFAQDCKVSAGYWEHSVAVGVCVQELAKHTRLSLDYAFVAGLLHDIGQLWLSTFYPVEFDLCRQSVAGEQATVIEAETWQFGVDHSQIGAWMVEQWELPPSMAAAVLYHHAPDECAADSLVAATHVGEVMANALDLGERPENQVVYLSPEACATVGIDWNDDLNYLFGKLEARTRHAIAVFR